MFRIVLCDDSPADLMVLCGHLEQLKEKRPVDIISYTDGLDLLKDYKQKGFCDILVLDMRMETMGGIEVAKHIRQLDDEVPILIVTATVDYAVEGYKVGAFRYIVKPGESGDFLSAVEELLDRQQKKQASIFSFPSINGTTKLMTDHIYYLESDLRTIRVVAKEGTFTFTGTISSLEEQLRPDGFIRIHKSFLVNVSHIYNIFKDSVTMDNKEVLPMSKHKRREVNQEFLSYMEANL